MNPAYDSSAEFLPPHSHQHQHPQHPQHPQHLQQQQQQQQQFHPQYVQSGGYGAPEEDVDSDEISSDDDEGAAKGSGVQSNGGVDGGEEDDDEDDDEDDEEYLEYQKFISTIFTDDMSDMSGELGVGSDVWDHCCSAWRSQGRA
jgi:hypothetical protein